MSRQDKESSWRVLKPFFREAEAGFTAGWEGCNYFFPIWREWGIPTIVDGFKIITFNNLTSSPYLKKKSICIRVWKYFFFNHIFWRRKENKIHQIFSQTPSQYLSISQNKKISLFACDLHRNGVFSIHEIPDKTAWFKMQDWWRGFWIAFQLVAMTMEILAYGLQIGLGNIMCCRDHKIPPRRGGVLIQSPVWAADM